MCLERGRHVHFSARILRFWVSPRHLAPKQAFPAVARSQPPAPDACRHSRSLSPHLPEVASSARPPARGHRFVRTGFRPFSPLCRTQSTRRIATGKLAAPFGEDSLRRGLSLPPSRCGG